MELLKQVFLNHSYWFENLIIIVSRSEFGFVFYVEYILTFPDWKNSASTEGNRGDKIWIESVFFFFFLAVPYGLWDLNSLTRDLTLNSLQWKLRVLTTGPPGNSLCCSAQHSETHMVQPPLPFSILSSILLPPFVYIQLWDLHAKDLWFTLIFAC